MSRNAGSKRDGANFSESVVEAVWQKGSIVSGEDSKKVRKDKCGAYIQRDKHGDATHARGWEIDHITPVAKGGGDEISNLQPLHWKNNRAKGDGPLQCVVS